MQPPPSSRQPDRKRRRLTVVYLIPDTRSVKPLSPAETPSVLEDRGEDTLKISRPFIDKPITGPIRSRASLTLEPTTENPTLPAIQSMPRLIKNPFETNKTGPIQALLQPGQRLLSGRHPRIIENQSAAISIASLPAAGPEEIPVLQKSEWDLTEADLEQDPEFSKQTTIPMMVLTSISQQVSLPAPTMQSEISGAAGNATISGIGNIIGYVLKTGSTFLMQHGLGVAAFGIYSLSFSVISFVASIFTFGLDDAMVRYIAIYRSKRQGGLIRNLTIFCTALAGISGLLGGFGVLYFAPWLARHLTHHAEVAPLLQLMAPIIPLTSMQMIWIAGLQGFKDFKKRVLAQRIIIPSIVVLLLLAVCILFPRNLTAIIIVTVISTLLSAVFSFYFLFGRVAQVQVQQVKESHYEVREWLGFATPNFLTNIVDIVLDAIDTLLLGYFGVPKVGIGQYSAAIKISGFIAMPLTSLNAMFSPTIAELHSKGEKHKLEEMFKVVTQWAITFSLPMFCISALFSVALLELLSGRDFVRAWPLLIAFGVGGMANAGTGSVGFMLLMTGHQKLSFINSLAAVIINLVLGILLTPRYGAMGTAISTGLATATVNFMRLLQVHFLLKIQPYRKDTLKPLGAGLISSLITGELLYLFHLAKWSVRVGHIHIPVELSLIPVFLALYIWVLMLFGASAEDKIVLDKLKRKLRRGKGRSTSTAS